MQTIKARGYVNLVEKRFVPTKIGIETNDKLQEFFNSIINVEYTANMEKDLDEIADDKIDFVKVLRDFYNNFEPLLEKAFKEMEKKEAEETGENCPNCGSPLVIRNGRFGEFVACSNYPTCKYIKQEERKIITACKCPKCDGRGYIKCKYNGYPSGLPDSGWVYEEAFKDVKCDVCNGVGYTEKPMKPKMVQDGWEVSE
jgi:DNA topoisomerase-1